MSSPARLLQFRLVAALLVLVVGASLPARGQTLALTALSPSNTPAHVDVRGAAIVVHDARHARVFVLSDSLLWTLDLERNRWSDPLPLALPDGVSEGAYDVRRDRLVLWNGGVGDVYVWRDGQAGLTRVDHSSPHRTQFGHAGFLHPRTGDIHAFGGYGFWYYRNMITRFDRATGEWQLVPLAEGSPQPAPRIGALATYWAAGDALFVLGGLTGSRADGRQEPNASVLAPRPGLWRYGYADATWAHVGALPDPLGVQRRYPSIDPPMGGNLGAFSAQDTSRALWFVSGRLSAQSGGPAQDGAELLAVHLPSGRIEQLGRLDSASESLLGLVWDAPRRRLVVLRIAMAITRPLRPVSVYATPVAIVEAAEPAVSRGLAIGVGAVGLVLMLGVGVWRWSRVPTTGTRVPTTGTRPELDEGEVRVVTVDPAGQMSIDGDALPAAERQLLALLHDARDAGQPYVPADVIEHAVWPENGGPDYTRKMRNQTMRRLSERLASDAVPPDEVILSRRSVEDRRRAEYALGPSVVVTVSASGPSADSRLTG